MILLGIFFFFETASFFPRLLLLFLFNLWAPSKIVSSFTSLFVCSVGRRIIGKRTINDSRPTLLCRKLSNIIDFLINLFLFFCVILFDWKLLSYWKCDHHDLLFWWVIGCILLASVAASVKCNKLEQMGKMIAWANITSNTLLEMALIITMITYI